MQASFLRRSILFIGAGLLAGASTASAQLPEVLTFRTVFPFVVGNREVPPGTYEIRRMNDDLFIYLIQGPKSAIFETNLTNRAPAGDRDKAEVVFHRYGDTLVMEEIWDPTSATGVVSTMTFKGVEEAAEHVAENLPATVIVPLTPGTMK